MWKIIDCRNITHFYETFRGFKRGQKYHTRWYIEQGKRYPDIYDTIECYKIVCKRGNTTWKRI